MEFSLPIHSLPHLRQPLLATVGVMIDVKNGKLSLQVGVEKVEFSLPQSMAFPTPGDSCCRVDGPERALNQEAKTCHYVGDPLEVILISCYVIDSHSGEKEQYARLLNESTTYTHRQSPREVLNMEKSTSKEHKKCPSKVELRPLPLHLRYKFLDSAH